MDGEIQWQTGKTFTSPKPAHTYYITLRVKATENSFASKPAERLSVTTPDALLIDGPAGKVSFETKGTYGQTLDQIPVQLAEGFQVVNYSRSPVSGTWRFSENQNGTSASSIYPEVKGTTAYQVEFIPDWNIRRAVWRNFDPKCDSGDITERVDMQFLRHLLKKTMTEVPILR